MSQSQITYITSPTAAQLEAYFKIRHKRYCEIWHLRDFFGVRDAYDEQSQFVLALDNDKIVGGVRLYIHGAESGKYLPLEHGDLVLDKLFPLLGLSKLAYFEAGRLAMDESYSQNVMISGLFNEMLALGKTWDCRYLFAVSPSVQARYYRRIFRGLGADYQIQSIEVPDCPDYEGIPMCLAMLDLAKVSARHPENTDSSLVPDNQPIIQVHSP